MEEEIKDYDKLTERQKRFIDYYIEKGSATKAAELAGYTGKNLDNIGSENLRKLGYYIKDKMQKKANDRIASQDEVLEYLTTVLRKQEKGCNIHERTKCAELLGKRYGIFKDKIELDQEKPFEVNINIKK